MKAQKQLRVNIQILKFQIYSLSTSLFNSGIILCLVFNFGSPELSFFFWLWLDLQLDILHTFGDFIPRGLSES